MNTPMKSSGVDWIGDIPGNWDVIRVKNAFIQKKEKALEENPVVLSLARSGVKIRDISKNEGQLAESYYNYNPVQIGDFLLNPMDLYSGANCNVSNIDGVISPAYVNLKVKNGYIAKYYDYFFKTQYWGMVLFAHGKGVSFENRWTINNETLMNYFVPAPPEYEQQKIVDFLDEKIIQIDSIIEDTKESIEEYKKYKQSLITETLTKGLNNDVEMKDSGIDWIGMIPKHWEKTKIGRISQLLNGDRSSNYPNENELQDNGVPFIGAHNLFMGKINNIKMRYISEEKYQSMSGAKIQINDIIYCLRGGTIGKNAISNLSNGTIASSLMVIRPTNISPKYLYYLLNSSFELTQRLSYINGTASPNLSAKNVGNYYICLPQNINEQQSIVKYLDEKCAHIDNLIEQKGQLLIELEKYIKSIIYEYVTGKKEVV